VVTVISGFELDEHQVDGGSGGTYEEYFHGGVVNTDEVRHEIQVTRHEDDQEKDLRLARDSRTTSGLPYLEKEDDDGQEMREIPQKSEYVHPEQRRLPFCKRYKINRIKI